MPKTKENFLLKLINETWGRKEYYIDGRSAYPRVLANNSMIRVFPASNGFRPVRCIKAQ